MAIDQHPRENLLLEATAYTRRCLYRVPRAMHWTAAHWTAAHGTAAHGTAANQAAVQPANKPVGSERNPERDSLLLREWLEPFQQQDEWELFMGLRADERWSIYFDEQPVMQFNRHNQLRRLYAQSKRYAASNGRLHRLDRQHLGGQVRLQQVELDEASQRAILNVCQQFLGEAAQALRPGRARRMGEFPAHDTAWLPAFEQNLQRVARDLTIAASPAH